MKRLMLAAGLCMACSGGAGAQTAVYAGFSASDFHLANVNWQYGPTFGLYYDHWGLGPLKAGVDVRASLLGVGTEKITSVLAGPRVQLQPRVVPLMPYAEVLIGGGHADIGQGVAHVDKTEVEYQVLGGLDATIFPHLDWRIVDYSWGDVTNLGEPLRPSTLSTGLVLRLP